MLPHVSAEVEVPMSLLALWNPPGVPGAQRLAWANGGGLLLADIATPQQPEGSGAWYHLVNVWSMHDTCPCHGVLRCTGCHEKDGWHAFH